MAKKWLTMISKKDTEELVNQCVCVCVFSVSNIDLCHLTQSKEREEGGKKEAR